MAGQFENAKALKRLMVAFLLGGSFLLVICDGLPASAKEEVLVVHYAPPESPTDRRLDYPLKLLDLALSKSGHAYRLEQNPGEALQGRVVTELEEGGPVDVMCSMTSIERENRLLPVRMPLDKGLLGYRIGLVRSADKELLSKAVRLQDLSQLQIGQGHDWPDVDILSSNGLHVHGVAGYENLFFMLAGGRIDYLSRSVMEISAELEEHPSLNLVMEPYLVLYYPTAQYFFVNRNNKRLAGLIEHGLEKAIADGSFEQLFQQYYANALRDAHFERRRLIKLNNPLLPPQTPLGRKELWYRPLSP